MFHIYLFVWFNIMFVMENIVKYIIHTTDEIKEMCLINLLFIYKELIFALSFRLIKNNFSGLHKI